METRLEAEVVITHFFGARGPACYLNMISTKCTKSIGGRAMEWDITASGPPSRTDYRQ
jgi:hypothetical protein